MNRIETIRERITRELDPLELEIRDDSSHHAGHAGAAGGAGHYAVKIMSGRFTGKSQLERHRMVYAAVHDLMPSEIHALSIHALAPDEQ